MSARRALFAGVLLVPLLVPAGVAEAARSRTVLAREVYVRNKPSGYTIGTVYTGQTVDV